MKVNKLSFFIALGTLLIAAHNSLLNASQAELMPTLPIEFQEAKFSEINKAFEYRWAKFLVGRNFSPWQSNQSDADILKEYEHVDRERRKAWYVDPDATTLVSRPDYILAQDLLARGFYRNLNTLAFDYNKTDASFNSSTVVLDGFRFLALEGPKPEHVSNFLNLLLNQHVTRLVRLTPAFEGKVQMSAPYWHGKTAYSKKDNVSILNIPQSTQGTGVPYSVPYYVMDKWLDQGAGDPKELLEFVLKVTTSSQKDIIACHCSSGVSRTGTFIAAFLLIHEIDKKLRDGQTLQNLDISVERTVSQLSLMRPHAVGKPKQYLTLYRLVDLYLKRAQVK